MRGEDRARAHRLKGLVEAHVVLVGQLAHPLDAQETGMPLIGVEHVGRWCAGQPGPQTQGADATDAEQHLLLKSKLARAPVEPVGDPAGRVVVVLDVGVEQQQGNPADLGLPHLRAEHAAAGKVDGDDAGRCIGLAQQGQRQAVRVEDRVGLLLPAVEVERLLEIAGLVEQANSDDGHPQIRGGLEVVPREDAKATGVLRQRLGDAELGAEVRDRGGSATLDLGSPALVPPWRTQVGREVLGRRMNLGHEHLVRSQALELVGRQRGEHGGGVLADRGPALWVDLGEQVPRGGVPRPAQIARELSQRADRLGQYGADAEATDSLHDQKA